MLGSSQLRERESDREKEEKDSQTVRERMIKTVSSHERETERMREGERESEEPRTASLGDIVSVGVR